MGLGLDEAQATEDPFLKHARQAEALRELFTMYLRILKRSPKSELLPLVLKGVARFVHLVNLDLVQALLGVLLQLAKGDLLPMTSGLESVHTIMMTLQGPGRELNVNAGAFVAYLYRLLYQLLHLPRRDEHIPMVIQCVNAMFLRKVEYQGKSVASFVSRLSHLALVCQPHGALALLSLIRLLTHRYKSFCAPLFDAEVELVGDSSTEVGEFGGTDPLLDDAASSTSLWALAQLRFHYHPQVRKFARGTLAMEPSLPAHKPEVLFQQYNPADGGFNPPVEKPARASQKKLFSALHVANDRNREPSFGPPANMLQVVLQR